VIVYACTGVFSECHNSDGERAQKLLVRVSHSWGGTTCLRLALEADDKNFVALSGVQVTQKSDFSFPAFIGQESCNLSPKNCNGLY